MPLSVDDIKDQIQPLIQKAQNLYPNIEFAPLVYDTPHPKSYLKNVLQSHEAKAYTTALKTIIQREFKAKESRFLGVAIYNKKKFLGLMESESFMSVFSIKASTVSDAHSAAYIFWHMLSHSLDCIDIRNSPKYSDSFMNGPMIPKRPAHQMALANLKADLFATLILSWTVDEEVTHDLIKKSCHHILTKQASQRAGLYPMPLAIEHIYFALETVKSAANLQDAIKLSRGLSQDILSAFDKDILSDWFQFVESAQEMAWLDYQDYEILSAAVHTSEKASVRNLAGDIANLLDIDPHRDFEIDKNYNPFLSETINARHNHIACEAQFKKLINGALVDRNPARLYEEAFSQSRKLLHGQGFGWYAHALVEAAKFIEQKKLFSDNAERDPLGKWKPEIMANFDRQMSQIRWQDIHAFSKTMIKQIASGTKISFEDLCQNALQNPDHSYIAKTLDECHKHNKTIYDNIRHIITPHGGTASAKLPPKPAALKSDAISVTTSLEAPSSIKKT